MRTLTHLDLFSGIGGFALAARWAGFQTIGFCEKEPYAQKVIIKNFGARFRGEQWPRDLVADAAQLLRDGSEKHRKPGGRQVPEFGIRSCADIRPDIFHLDGTQYTGVDLLTGGFPCQPFSTAGKRKGKSDDRAIWPEMLRVITQARPRWVIGENVAGITSVFEFACEPPLDGQGNPQGQDGDLFTRTGNGYLLEIVEALTAIGYNVQPVIIPACAVDARHRRDRVWIVAADTAQQLQHGSGFARHGIGQSANGGCDVSDANNPGPQGRERGELQECSDKWIARTGNPCRWQPESEWFAESGMGRVADGIPARVDRLKGLGNAIVPQVALQIIQAIAAALNSEMSNK